MKCLVKKLQDAFDSNEMPWFNGLRIRLTGGFNYSSPDKGASVGINKPVVVKENGSSLGYGKIALYPSHNYVFENEGDIYLLVKEINPLLLFNARGDGFDKTNVICSVKDYIYGASIVNVNTINADNFVLSGNISDFADYKMNQISYRATTNAFFGTLEGLIEKYYKNGITDSYELTVYIPNSAVTFHGSQISYGMIAVFSSGVVTVKNSSTQEVLATYNGSTWTYA